MLSSLPSGGRQMTAHWESITLSAGSSEVRGEMVNSIPPPYSCPLGISLAPAVMVRSVEPLVSVSINFLSMKTALLVALVSFWRVRMPVAFSVSESCQEFGPAYSHVYLRPRFSLCQGSYHPLYIKVVVNLRALSAEETGPAFHCMSAHCA